MNTKGFTLIELLGVIAILAILAVIAIPVIDSSINKNKEKLYQTQISQIKKGAEDYYATRLSELPEKDGDSVTKTIDDLQKAGTLALNIENPKTGKDFNKNTTITVTKVGSNYKYEVNEVE